jgi:secreted trypsin-like serine protease
MLAGVVNSGRARCGLELAYALYADVTQYHDFINRTMARNPGLGFDSICPAQVLLDDVDYAEPDPDTGRQQVTLNWTGVEYAEHYRLWFTPATGSSAAVGQLQLPATVTSFSAELQSGDGYLVAVQASNALCDGFRSASARVAVP